MAEDHHSAYLARAVAALTPDGTKKVNEILAQLSQAASGRDEWLTRFAMARRAEADGHALAPLEVEPGEMLSETEIDALTRGFMLVRDNEHLDDVADWANAVLQLLQDEREHHGFG
jgi:hypothetical protein